jgi:uncharacterized protein (TIGR03435 family)
MLAGNSMIRFVCAPLLLGLAISSVAPSAQAPQFEVASVKLVKGPVAPHGVGLLINHGKLTIEAAQLRQIVGLAFGIQRVLVQGCPDWCDEDMFDIVAKTDNVDATRDQIRPMLQTLLAGRFKLAAHRTNKEVQGYTLTVAKGGPKLPEAKDQPGATNVFTPYAGGLQFANMGINGLVNYLANILGQPVRDTTGLTGRYNFKLELRGPDGQDSGPQVIDMVGIVSSSVEQQLGLKLLAAKVPTDILIIDHAERPSEN